MEKNNNQNQKIICKSEFEKITNVTELLNFCKSKDKISYEDLDSKTLSGVIQMLIENLREQRSKKIKKALFKLCKIFSTKLRPIF